MASHAGDHHPRSTTTAGLTPRTVEPGGSPTGSGANPAIRVLVWDSLVYLIPLSVKWDPHFWRPFLEGDPLFNFNLGDRHVEPEQAQLHE
jgi:hypothetical protein